MKREEGNKPGGPSSFCPRQLCAVRWELNKWVSPDMWKCNFLFAMSWWILQVFPHKELTLVFMVRIHWAEDWSEALNAHLPAFLGQGLALKPPWCLIDILQDPPPDKISLCRTDLENFYTLSHPVLRSQRVFHAQAIFEAVSVLWP